MKQRIKNVSWISISPMDHLNRKAFDKNQLPFVIKTLNKMSINQTYLNIIKAI